MTLLVATIVLLAYVLGSIPFGLLVSQSQGIDIRDHGSRNIGATNVWRIMGKKWGILTFACDMGKGLLAVLAAKWIATRWAIPIPLPHGAERITHLGADFAGIAAAMGCILGHNFPVWLRFKGGKGVATSLGVICGMMPLAAVLVLAVWGIVFKVTRYVSLASLLAAVAFPVIVVALLFTGWLHGWGNFYFAVAAALLVIRRHRTNIARLVAGTESRFGTKSNADTQPANPHPPAD